MSDDDKFKTNMLKKIRKVENTFNNKNFNVLFRINSYVELPLVHLQFSLVQIVLISLSCTDFCRVLEVLQHETNHVLA